MKKRIIFVSLGCDKNLVDTEMMIGLLQQAGYTFTDDEAEADIAVINTCCFIGDAKEESINTILEFADYKNEGLIQAIIVTGCLAQRYREEIQAEIEEVDAIVGTTAIDAIVEAVNAVVREIDSRGGDAPAVGTCSVVADSATGTGSEMGDSAAGAGTEMGGSAAGAGSEMGGSAAGAGSEMGDSAAGAGTEMGGSATGTASESNAVQHVGCREYFADLNRAPLTGVKRSVTTGGYYDYLKIAEGCDKHCTYCIIPKVRGNFRSIPMESLVGEAVELVQKGVRELILVAQETTLYGMDLYGKKSLPELLRRLNEIQDLRWIRIMYCYPEEIDDELIRAMKELPKVCHYLDIPIQHASDSVLKRMGRRTMGRQLADVVAKLRKEIPDICLRTTLITGFPGETAEDHEEVLRFVDETEFDRLGVFPYSVEEDTPAALMDGQIDEDVKLAYRDEIMELQQEIAFDKAEQMVGLVMEAMIEGRVTEDWDSDSMNAFGESDEKWMEDGEDGMNAFPVEAPDYGNVYAARTYRDAPGIDGMVFIRTDRNLMSGDFVKVRITDFYEYDLIGVIEDEFAE